MSKIWGFSIENCNTSEVFKNIKYPNINNINCVSTAKIFHNVIKYPEINRMYVSLHAWERGWRVQCKIPIHALLNFQFLKTLPVPQFSILNENANTRFLIDSRNVMGLFFSKTELSTQRDCKIGELPTDVHNLIFNPGQHFSY